MEWFYNKICGEKKSWYWVESEKEMLLQRVPSGGSKGYTIVLTTRKSVGWWWWPTMSSNHGWVCWAIMVVKGIAEENCFNKFLVPLKWARCSFSPSLKKLFFPFCNPNFPFSLAPAHPSLVSLVPAPWWSCLQRY